MLGRARFASPPFPALVPAMSVVTRFAPSPTGYLHIGGARTALFNWLFTRANGGKYLLRIEDTDRARSTPEAIEAIQDGLSWLGLEGDEPPVFQFVRAERHREVAEAMLERGTAFRCYMTPEETEVARTAAHAAGGPLRSPWRDSGGARPDMPYTVRLRAPDDGEVVNDDLIQGRVAIQGREIDDLVMLRADATPTYMLSVVVDDHDMGVTHVIRGDDHLTNAARQIPIFQAMGWTAPKFAHVSLIHGPDGAKLSKRHGALGVQAYRDMGYLPEAMCAYLMRLGWSPGHDDVVSKEEAVQSFRIDQIGKAPSRLDFAKLDSVNAHFLRSADDARLAKLVLNYIDTHKDWALSPVARQRVAAAIPVLKARAKTIIEIAEQARFLIVERPLDASALSALKDDVKARLLRLRDRLQTQADWTADALGAAVKQFAADEGVGLGQIGPGLRIALTGGTNAPDLGHVLHLLGREESLARISDLH